jgi:hypothetical protein
MLDFIFNINKLIWVKQLEIIKVYNKMCNDYKNLNLINLSKADIIKLIILYNINEEELTNEEQNTIKKLLIKSKENNLYN